MYVAPHPCILDNYMKKFFIGGSKMLERKYKQIDDKELNGKNQFIIFFFFFSFFGV